MESRQVLVDLPAAAPPAASERAEKFSLFALTTMVVGVKAGSAVRRLAAALLLAASWTLAAQAATTFTGSTGAGPGSSRCKAASRWCIRTRAAGVADAFGRRQLRRHHQWLVCAAPSRCTGRRGSPA
jgi:hypothetical protein